MWDPKEETDASLRAYARRQPIGMMEAVFIKSAKDELERRRKEKEE